MNIRIGLVVTVLIFLGVQVTSAQNCPKGSFLVMFYNVENLFDTVDVSGKYDEEFTPDGENQWNTKRYRQKVNDLSKVISQIGGKKPADLVGLAEIENRNVLKALNQNKNLQNVDYGIVHFESPDERGIDVALLYRETTVNILYKNNLFVDFAWDPDDRTRDVLYVKLQANEQDTMHVFVNHWSSRGGGVEATAPKRIRSATIVRKQIDSLKQVNPKAKIIVMGDLNDNPDNISVRRVLDANGIIDYTGNSLYNLAWKPYKRGEGSYHYWREDEWNMLDQMIVSRSVLHSNQDLELVNKEQCIFRPEWILYENDDGTKVPSKTYGRSYYGGISDHLPVYFYLD